MDVIVTMRMNIDANDLEKLKTIEHHADYLLDLDNWPEIKSVSNVTVQPAN